MNIWLRTFCYVHLSTNIEVIFHHFGRQTIEWVRQWTNEHKSMDEHVHMISCANVQRIKHYRHHHHYVKMCKCRASLYRYCYCNYTVKYQYQVSTANSIEKPSTGIIKWWIIHQCFTRHHRPVYTLAELPNFNHFFSAKQHQHHPAR